MGGYLSVLVPRYQGVSHSDYVCVTYMLAGHTSEEEEVLKGRIYPEKKTFIFRLHFLLFLFEILASASIAISPLYMHFQSLLCMCITRDQPQEKRGEIEGKEGERLREEVKCK